MAAGTDIAQILRRVRDHLIQFPLPTPSSTDVGTLNVKDDIQLSPQALASLKKQLGL